MKTGGSTWADSDLVVDLPGVFRVTDQDVLVREFGSEVVFLVQRQRSLVVLVDPGPSARSPELRLHAAGSGGELRTGSAALIWF